MHTGHTGRTESSDSLLIITPVWGISCGTRAPQACPRSLHLVFRVPVSEGLADVKMRAPIGLITADMVAPCAGVKPKGRLGRVTSRRAADSRRPVLPRSRRTTERGLLGSRAQSRVCPPQWSARLQHLWRWQTPGQVEICRASGAVVTHAWTLDCLHETGYSALSVTLGSMAFHDEILCLGRGRSHAVSMPGRPGMHTGQDQRGGRSFGGGRGPPHYARDNGVAPMSVSPAGPGAMRGRGRIPGRGRQPDQVHLHCCSEQNLHARSMLACMCLAAVDLQLVPGPCSKCISETWLMASAIMGYIMWRMVICAWYPTVQGHSQQDLAYQGYPLEQTLASVQAQFGRGHAKSRGRRRDP